MNLIKLTLSILITLPYHLALADVYTDQAIAKIQTCYDAADKIDPEFMKCSLDELRKYPNPLNYKCHVHTDDERKSAKGKISIIFYTPSGFMVYCIGTAGDKLIINSCATKQGKPITERDELIIQPPK
ncbi:hypothetical protein [Legionella maioricensis]|uniref:Uncharacterized protein n=1 Tax=Legionella maioricensis TaxID=2896528 RepID=A0A9X2D328_9GAMM|nr:hypothetical protein [Legionella maioricensis]MCL9685424.1 hypothetical protein [Legionella maioricensis]MCL9688726.1 hypothetical protein [Legionella maioricensis]